VEKRKKTKKTAQISNNPNLRYCPLN